MTPEQAAEAVKNARESLAEYATVRADLPRRIRVADALGISIVEIAQLSGIARTTVAKHLGR